MIDSDLIPAFLEGKTTKDQTMKLLRAMSVSGVLFNTVVAAAVITSKACLKKRREEDERNKQRNLEGKLNLI
jgi:hypothetical protein